MWVRILKIGGFLGCVLRSGACMRTLADIITESKRCFLEAVRNTPNAAEKKEILNSRSVCMTTFFVAL